VSSLPCTPARTWRLPPSTPRKSGFDVVDQPEGAKALGLTMSPALLATTRRLSGHSRGGRPHERHNIGCFAISSRTVQNAGSRLSDPRGNCRYLRLGRRADNLLRQRASRPLMGWSAAFLLSWPASYREPRCRAFRIVAGATCRRPCIFLDEEVKALINDAACPNPRHPFRPVVLSTLLGHRLARRRGDPPEHKRRTAR
jgi:hypothetical protein